MAFDFEAIPGAVETFLRSSPEAQEVMKNVGLTIRDEARRNASAITQKTDALISQTGSDADGPYVDIGYAKKHPGFFLWWYEVGTRYDAPRPHLRPAVRSGILDNLPASSAPSDPTELLDHVTRDGRTIQGTRAQIANWTRGGATP